MNYVDATLAHLADANSRSQLFDDTSLQQLLAAAYDTDAMPIQGPFTPQFDALEVGVSAPPLAALNGSWNPAGGAERVEARFRLEGFRSEPVIRIDANWRGSIVARTVRVRDRVIQVDTDWLSPGTLDEQIIADLGALPNDPAVLETERRTRFLTRIRAALDEPNILPDSGFDTWLNNLGASSVSDMMTRLRGTVTAGTARLTFSAPDPAPPTPLPLPISAVLLIRDESVSIAELLTDSKTARQQLVVEGLDAPHDPTLRLKQQLVVTWVLPLTVFDDPDWPGANGGMTPPQARDARRDTAGAWLAREGIGLVATDSS